MTTKLFSLITRGKLIRNLCYEHTRFRKKPDIKNSDRKLKDLNRVYDFNAW